ncbi:NF-kappa-B inhibitor cactus [Chironomus tepperi]|uniref:NF-kappa-B inhibitor cactus n=1 Tax=Chironomus tepperi TaxID=113505 RepID=UPI00391F8C7A
MSTFNESIEKREASSNENSKKIFDEQVYCDSGFITESCELLSSEQSKETTFGADNKSQDTDMTTNAKGKSHSNKDNENYTDSGIVSCSNISSSTLSTSQTKGMHVLLELQSYVPEYMLRSLSGIKKQPHPTLQIEKYFEQDEDGYTKLHIAILHNIEPAIQVLINYAPDESYLNIRTFSGQSALHLAVLLNQSLTIKRLIDAGADVNIRDNRCNSPLHLAVLNEDINSVKIILAAIYPKSKTSSNEDELIANLEQWNYDGETCFYVACRLNNIPIMKLLAKHGANINAREGRSGYSALHLAVETHSNDVIKFLCEDCESIDLDYENYGGFTAFQLSLLTNQEALANYLVKKGATAYYTPESDYDDDDSDVSTNEFEELEKNQLVNKIAEIAVN